MKKILAVLLALAVIGSAFAQTSFSYSGKLRFAQSTDGNAPLAKIAEDGNGYDILKVSLADKDGKYGVSFQDGQFDLNQPVFSIAQAGGYSNLNVWYQYDFGRFDFGNAGGGFTTGLASGYIGSYGPSGFGSGVIFTLPAMGALTAAAYVPLTTTAVDSVKNLMNSGVSVKYAIENIGTVTGLVLLNAGGTTTTTVVNAGFSGGLGVEGLNVYGFGEFGMGTTSTITFGAGASFATGPIKAGLEFEGVSASALAYNLSGDVTYKLNSNISFDLYPGYYDTGALFALVRARYAFGNGLSVNVRGGYNKGATAYASYDGVIYAAYLQYGISL